MTWNEIILSIITGLCLIISFIADRQKTWVALKKSFKMFINLLPVLLLMLGLVSIFLFLIPNETIIKYIGKDSGIEGWFVAALVGSIALIPGFVAFPLCAILIKSGVGYPTIAVFITTLMMVGIISLPVEAKFFGWKTSIIRNSLSFIAALIIGFLMSLFL
jgi:uncharacterized membrane protein YraQ (UPF0718 family)